MMHNAQAGKEAPYIPQYQVTMNLTKADPLLDVGQLTRVVTDAVLPSLEALLDLQSKGKG
jgi:hypothetical protein